MCGFKIDAEHALHAPSLQTAYGCPLTYCAHCGSFGLTLAIRNNQLSWRVVALEQHMERGRQKVHDAMSAATQLLKLSAGIVP